MNYFNYFTEIEDEFVRRRGKHLLVSPLDWSLIEAWRQRGIPLRVALRGISQSFDVYDQQPRKFGRTVNSLLYCQPAVEEAYQQYLNSQVGGADGSGEAMDPVEPEEKASESGFSISTIRLALEEWQESVVRLRARYSGEALLSEGIERAANRLGEVAADLPAPDHRFLEQLDAELSLIERILSDAVFEHAGEEKVAKLRNESEKELKHYRSNMEKEMYLQTLNNRIAQKLRAEYGVPRLSLFSIQ